MKKLLAIFLTVSLTLASLLTVGCSNKNKTANTSLYIAYENSGYGDAWMQAMIEGFKKLHPEVKIEDEGDSQLHTKVGREIENGGEGYDIIFTQGINWASYAATGLLANLDDVYASTDSDGVTIEQRLLQNIVNFGKALGSDGKEAYYSFPYGLSVMGIVYNVEMFNFYGWKIPKTYSELVTLCNTIKRDTARRKWTTKTNEQVMVAPFTYPGQYADYWRAVTYPWSAQYDGIDQFESFYEYNNKTAFYSDGRLKSLEKLAGLNIEATDNSRNALIGTMSKDHTASQQDFALGYSAMIPNGSWVETEIAKSLDNVYEFAMMPPIAFDETHNTPAFWTNNSNHVLIPARSNNKEIAKEFLKYVCEKENAFKILELSNSFMPLNYDYTETLDTLTSFGKSVATIWKNSYPLVGVSTNPMRTFGIAIDWPAVTEPTTLIMEGQTPAEVMEKVRNYTNANYDNWVKKVEELYK